jgi:hypothetical protein
MTLEARIEKLEKANRNWRRAALSTSILVAMFLAFSASEFASPSNTAIAQLPKKPEVTDTLRVRRLEVINNEGTTCAVIDSRDAGGALALHNNEGKLSAVIGSRGDGANLVLLHTGADSNNNFPQIFLSTTLSEPQLTVEGDGARLRLRGNSVNIQSKRGDDYRTKQRLYKKNKQKPLTEMELEQFKDVAESVVRASLGLTTANGGSLSIKNSLGEEAVSIQSNKANEGAIILSDSTGKIFDALGRPR